MATEQGVVTRVTPHTAWVKTTRTEACQGCSARKTCHTLGGGSESEVEAVNAPAAQPGDRVLLMFKTASLLKATSLIYLLPIIVLLCGAGVGHRLAALLDWDPSIAAAVFGFGFFGAALAYVKKQGNRMADNAAYQPRIIRVLRRENANRFDNVPRPTLRGPN
jgi:sigma-E factor negative regulatory protein RseC